MTIMNNDIFEIIGKLMSGIVFTFIVFRYLDERYKRMHERKWIYMITGIFCCFLNLIVTCFNIPVLNISFWLIAVTLIGRMMYFDEYISQRKYYLVNIIFVLSVSLCELAGVICINEIIKLFKINPNIPAVSFVGAVFGAQSTVLFYYLLLERFFIRKKTNIIYALIAILVLVNGGTIIFMLGRELSRSDCLFLVLNSVFALIINVYLFYMLDTYTENKDLNYKKELYERQAQSYYNYYIKQAENHNKPLSNFDYCNNQMLNVILNDKADFCKEHNIKFDALIYDINIDFMETIDITTLFGNILDNAVDACSNLEKKGILLKMHPFNGITYVCLSNTFSGKVQFNSEGKLMAGKDGQHRIGLENVERVLDKYNGDMKIETDNNVFTIHLMLNHV